MSPAKKTTTKPKKASSPTGEVDRAYFAAQSPDKRALLEKLRALVAKGAPGAVPAIKWGVAVYAVNGRNVCALAAFKDHVAINFFAPSDVFVDPGEKLEGSGKSSRLFKVRTPADIDAPGIQRWLKAAVAANS